MLFVLSSADRQQHFVTKHVMPAHLHEMIPLVQRAGQLEHGNLAKKKKTSSSGTLLRAHQYSCCLPCNILTKAEMTCTITFHCCNILSDTLQTDVRCLGTSNG